jgi:UDP-glucose 4-epimerase
MNVIVTGATGFIGSKVVPLLFENKHKTIALHRRENRPPALPGVCWIRCELDKPDWNSISVNMEGEPNVLIHLAAHGVLPVDAEWQECFKWNVMKTLDLYQSAISHGINRIITCGSCFEYGDASNKYDFIPNTAAPEPRDAYAASKAAATMMLHGLTSAYGIEAIVFRPCVVYGDGERPNRLWPSLYEAAIKGRDFPMSSGHQVRDFIPVTSVAEAIVNAVARKDLVRGKTCIENLGSGNPQSVKAFASKWWNKWGASGKLLFGSLPDRKNETARIVPKI